MSTKENCIETIRWIKEIFCLNIINLIPWKKLIFLKEKEVLISIFYEKYFKNQMIQIEEIKNIMKDNYETEEEIKHFKSFILVFQNNYPKEFKNLFQILFENYTSNEDEKCLKFLFFISQININLITENEKEILFQNLKKKLNLYLIKVLICLNLLKLKNRF